MIKEADINLETVREENPPLIPPWTLKQPNVILQLCKDKKSTTLPEKFKLDFCELKSHFSDYIDIYTDGSKDGEKVGCASVSDFHTFKRRLPDNASIFTAEIQAIDLAFRYISVSKFKNFIIFSDSLSVLQSLKNRNLSNPLVQELLLKHHNLSSSINVVFCWLPSHIGIQGNEKADIAAKHSLNLDVVGKLKLPCSDLKPCINKYIVSKWQHEWDDCTENKLHSIKPILGESLLVNRSVRREEVVLSRCRIGHSFMTHVYLLRREEQPECVFCQEPITIKHLLLDCADLIDTRVK